MGTINAGTFSSGTGVKIADHNGSGNYPSGLGAGDKGFLIYDSSINKLLVWTGAEWEEIKTKGQLGLDAGNAAASATAILANDPTAGNGIYWLNHGGGAYQAYCDMSNGGYILCAKIPQSPNDTSNPWSYNGSRWNASTPVNESLCQNTSSGDSLNRAYYEYSATVGFRFAMSSVTNVLAVARSGVTPKDAFTGSQYNTSLSRNDFLNWIPESSSQWNNQPHCNRNGFNRTDSSSAAMRFGHTMNNENECNSNDSAVGFGCYTNNQSSSGSRNCAAGGFRWNGTVRYPYNGWIFVK
tara:strand:- start:235 stop:1122 length:888 start_codon:yes stop_codon:yes gene_type:complete